MIKQQLQTKLLHLIRKHHKTQAAYARHIGVSRQEVNVYLTGSISVDRLEQLIEDFGVEIELLFTDTESH